MMRLLKLLILFYLPNYLSRAANVPLNGICNPTLTRLDPATHKMLSDCDDKYFCNNATCQWKGCRQYDHDILYEPEDTVPPFCPRGTYCPDAQNACQPVLPLGSRCELDRDDECAPSPGLEETMCLQFTCRLAIYTAGQPCTIEDTQYNAPYLNGTIGTVLISRDNCKHSEFYCDRNSTTCQSTLGFGVSCDEDRQCTSASCDSKEGTCARPLQAPIPISPLTYSITVTALMCVMAVVVSSLIVVHNRQRVERNREREEYYREQTTFRHSIVDLHAIARARAKQ